VVCATTDGKFSIAIGDVITGVIVGLEQDASKVRGVGLGDVNGVVLNCTDGVPGDTATAVMSQRFADVGKQRDAFRLRLIGSASSEHCCRFTHVAFGPFGVEAAKNVVLELECLRTVTHILVCEVRDLTLAEPVQDVVQAADSIESDLPAFVEGEVVPAVVADVDIESVVRQQADSHSADFELS
jgi:hypothetical protein